MRNNKPQRDDWRLVLVTDPAEQAALLSDALIAPIGGFVGGVWLAYAWTLERYRAFLLL